MKRFIIISAMMASACLPSAAQDFARGADISWVTEMEADGRKFYNSTSEETDAFELMKQIGMNAIRLRVFVDPAGYGYGSWCDKADVTAKAQRAHAQGLDLMIDFHYSDFFADPEHQNVPQAWADYSTEQVKVAMVAHTTEVLQALNDAGISPKWVQVGNETNSGIAMPHGPVEWDKSGADRFAKYVVLSNACYDAVKAVCPDAYVIVHLGGSENARWFFPDFLAAGGKVDMIGLSHYPTEDQWNSNASTDNCSNVNAAKYVSAAITDFGVPVMICETGFDVSKPALAQRVMIDLFNRLTPIDGCAGIFYWEPLTDGVWKPSYYDQIDWGAYSKGAFTTDGRHTKALDAFGGATEPDGDYPASLTLYRTDYSTALATLLPDDGADGIYSGKLSVTEPWLNFVIYDGNNGVWYGTDPAGKTMLSSADDRWNCWIDSEALGDYDITVNLATMSWSQSYCASVASIAKSWHEPIQYTDLCGRQVAAPSKGNIYVARQGARAGLIYY